MTPFKREQRYIVLKRADVENLPIYVQNDLDLVLDSIRQDIPDRHYVVIESDWPEYAVVWKMIEDRCK